MKLACSTVAFDGHPLEGAIGAIAELGFDGVELGFIEGYVGNFSDELFSERSAARVRSLLAGVSLPCSAVSGHIDLSERDSVERAFLRLRFAAAVGAPFLVTNAAVSLREAAFYRNMGRIVREAEKVGVVVCLENPGNGVANVLDGGASARRVMERIAHPLVRINYDFANTASHLSTGGSGRFEAERDFLEVLPWLVQLHLKDVRREADGEYIYPALGEGEIDFRAVFRSLVVAGSQPRLSLEVPVRLRRRPGGAPYRLEVPVAIEETMHVLRRSKDYVIGLSRPPGEDRSN